MGMDTEEMYRRGVADAEKGEPHPFYYQHYYQYRRGYDRTRRSLGLPGGIYDQRRRRLTQALMVVAALLLVAAAVFVYRGRARPTSAGVTSRTATAAPTRAPTRAPIFPTPTAAPTAVPTLHVGGSATVANTQGSVLRGRKQPGVKAPVAVTFREGTRVSIVEGPVEADGFTWWKIQDAGGAGWSAQQSPEGVVWLQPVADQ